MKVWYGAVVLSILSAGCSAKDAAETGAEPAGRPVVYASNYPLQYFAQKISAPLVDVRLPVPSDQDPAFWAPTPEDVAALQKADLVLLNGASYESWLKNVSLPSSRLVDTTEGLQEQFIALEESVTHSHGPDGEHEHSATAFTTWLDLALAIEQARAIQEAFSKRWPEHQGQFEAQFQKLVQELEALDAEISQAAKAAAGVPVLFSHPVYQYFERRYQVNGRSVHWEPDEMPSESMWQELTALLSAHPAKWMIWEGEPAADVSAKLAELGVQSIVFTPCGGAPAAGDFASVMKRNVQTLKAVGPGAAE
jgi:zinc transport system substrate-binding protein